jgi:hypothetical protein
MTVKELIEDLMKLDQDARVVVDPAGVAGEWRVFDVYQMSRNVAVVVLKDES